MPSLRNDDGDVDDDVAIVGLVVVVVVVLLVVYGDCGVGCTRCVEGMGCIGGRGGKSGMGTPGINDSPTCCSSCCLS